MAHFPDFTTLERKDSSVCVGRAVRGLEQATGCRFTSTLLLFTLQSWVEAITESQIWPFPQFEGSKVPDWIGQGLHLTTGWSSREASVLCDQSWQQPTVVSSFTTNTIVNPDKIAVSQSVGNLPSSLCSFLAMPISRL